MDCVPDSELMPQLLRMEAHLRSLIPVCGEDPAKVRKSDLYRTIAGLRRAA